MDSPLTESEADTLFTQSRDDNQSLRHPAAHDSFLQFVRLLSAVDQPPGKAILVYRRTPGATPEAHVLGDTFTLGKTADCTLSVPELPAVSRLHLTIERTASGYFLTDRSRNGTFLYPGTTRIAPGEPYLLKDGDLLWVEGMVLAFKGAS